MKMSQIKESEERKLLKVMVYAWLKEAYCDLGRKLGPACKKIGLSLKDAEPLMLELTHECFQLMKTENEKEYGQRNAGSEKKAEGIGFKC